MEQASLLEHCSSFHLFLKQQQVYMILDYTCCFLGFLVVKSYVSCYQPFVGLLILYP